MHKPMSVEDIIRAPVLLAKYMIIKDISPIKLETTKQYLWPKKSWSQIPIIAPAGITRKGKPPERIIACGYQCVYWRVKLISSTRVPTEP